jgi:hypothetical protein
VSFRSALLTSRGSAFRHTSAPLALILAAVAAALVCLGPASPVRWLAGSALVLGLPGCAVRRALPWTSPGRLVSFIVDVSLSLSCLIFVAFALNVTGPGIQRSTLAVSLAVITVLAAVCETIRSANGDGATDVPARAAVVRRHALPVLAFAAVAGGAVWLAATSQAAADRRVTTTELSVQQLPGGRASVEVTNLEGRTMDYELTVSASGHQIASVPLTLAATATASRAVSTASAKPGTRINVILRRRGVAGPAYRQVWLVAGGAGTSAASPSNAGQGS